MRVVIAGSRFLQDYTLVPNAVQDSGFHITEIVSGNCHKGVDYSGEVYAKHMKIPLKLFPADWDSQGHKAGPIRNMAMAKYADAAIVIWDGMSPGSRNMLQCMRSLSKPVYEYNLMKLGKYV